ncbi:hypothetical protein EON65_37665 [archaeon]|nr:MAG: hypothetical protein EON65_37665 [archaeon]
MTSSSNPNDYDKLQQILDVGGYLSDRTYCDRAARINPVTKLPASISFLLTTATWLGHLTSFSRTKDLRLATSSSRTRADIYFVLAVTIARPKDRLCST